jgi:hypothetical protein
MLVCRTLVFVLVYIKSSSHTDLCLQKTHVHACVNYMQCPYVQVELIPCITQNMPLCTANHVHACVLLLVKTLLFMHPPPSQLLCPNLTGTEATAQRACRVLFALRDCVTVCKLWPFGLN